MRAWIWLARLLLLSAAAWFIVAFLIFLGAFGMAVMIG